MFEDKDNELINSAREDEGDYELFGEQIYDKDETTSDTASDPFLETLRENLSDQNDPDLGVNQDQNLGELEPDRASDDTIA